MKDVVENYKNYELMGKKQASNIKKNFNLEAMQNLLTDILDKYVTKRVALKLPQLKKIELPKLKSI
jgi:hypothetical protein